MKNSVFLVLFLSACAGAPSASTSTDCEVGESRPFSVSAKGRGEVFVERIVSNNCGAEERLVWGKSEIALPGGDWRAGDLKIWRGQVALDLHKFFDGHPLECHTWLYKFGKSKLQLVRKRKTCGP